MEYVHAMRAVVENLQARSDCHPKEVYRATVLAQQYHITKGLKIYGDRGREAVKKEMKQLDDMEAVKPKRVSIVNPTWEVGTGNIPSSYL